MKSIQQVVRLTNHPDKPLTEFQKAMYSELLLQLASSDLREQIMNVSDGENMDIWNNGVDYSENFYDRELAGKIYMVWAKVKSSMASPSS